GNSQAVNELTPAIGMVSVMASASRLAGVQAKRDTRREPTQATGPDGATQPAAAPASLSLFFFSSRRRHTRFSRDWSSDVCSSDLPDLHQLGGDVEHTVAHGPGRTHHRPAGEGGRPGATRPDQVERGDLRVAVHDEIGRASCRESAESAAADVARDKKKRYNRSGTH